MAHCSSCSAAVMGARPSWSPAWISLRRSEVGQPLASGVPAQTASPTWIGAPRYSRCDLCLLRRCSGRLVHLSGPSSTVSSSIRRRSACSASTTSLSTVSGAHSRVCSFPSWTVSGESSVSHSRLSTALSGPGASKSRSMSRSGYVPYTVVYPRWSFSYAGADFSAATVTMRRASGASVALV